MAVGITGDRCLYEKVPRSNFQGHLALSSMTSLAGTCSVTMSVRSTGRCSRNDHTTAVSSVRKTVLPGVPVKLDSRLLSELAPDRFTLLLSVSSVLITSRVARPVWRSA